MAGDDVTITVRVNDRTAAGFRDVNGRLRDMNGRFAAASGDMRRSARDLDGSMTTLRGSVMSLAPSFTQVGAVLGTALLPALGAAAPAMLGLGAAAGTLKLGFAGVSNAVALAGTDQKKYAETLKKMGPEQRDFTKALVDAKKEFRGVGREVQRAMLPGFTKAVKDAGPVVKILGDAMTELGGAFGDAAEGLGRMMKDSGFQKDLQANLKLGTGFVKDMTSAMGPFTRSFLDFGAKSQPTLDALSGLAGGVLTTGLPGMFKGLEAGIGGSAKVIDGLGYALNDKLLPGLGELSGQFAKLAGPTLQQALMLLGDLGGVAFKGVEYGLKAMAPLLNDAANGLRGLRTFGADVAPTLKDVGAALASVFVPTDYTSMTGPLTSLADAIDRNKGAIQEGARIFGLGVLNISEVVFQTIPPVIKMFRLMSLGVLTSLDAIVSGAAHAFGWVPGIGDKLEGANKAFDKFKDGYLDSLGAAERKASEFAAAAGPALSRGKLKLNINNWMSQIATAKEQMKSVPPEKRAALRAHIADLQAKVRQAKEELASLHGKTVTITTNKVTKFSTIGAPGSGGIPVAKRDYATGGLVRGYAGGGDVQSFPDGGYIQGPGSGTSDSILGFMGSGAVAAVSNTEYVMKAAAVRKYGVKMMDAINEGRLPIARLAKGGTTKAEREARAQAMGNLTVSHFGQYAGYKRSEFGSALGKPDSITSLVNALNEWRSIIKKATHGSTENKLLKQLDSTGKKLLDYEKKLNSVTKNLEKARDKLNSLKDAAASLSNSVKGNILSSANITRGAGGEGTVTLSSIRSGLTASRDKATAFADALKQLKEKGLSGSLLQQIAEAGIEGGGLETAGALLGASGSEIKSLNDMQAQITKAAGAAGKVTADAVYGAQIKLQQKLVHDLTHEQKKLTTAMDKLTKAMEKAIEAAFGKKAAGGIVGAAASGGLRSSLTWVGERGPELLDLPAGSRVWSNPDSRRMAAAPWASMIDSPRRAPSYGYAQAGPAQPQEVRVVFDFRGSGTNNELERALIKMLRKTVRDRGGDTQRVFGAGGYRVGPGGRVVSGR